MKTFFKTIDQLIAEKNKFIDCIPNNLGINLCYVKGVEYKRQEDNQLIDLKIIFSPEPAEMQDGITLQFDFGTAICALKQGKKVARKGWNGKGMYLYLKQGYPVNGRLYPSDHGEVLPNENPDGTPNVTQCKSGQMLSHIVMKTAGDSQYWGSGYSDYVPWLASQTDMLAEDWEIVE